MSDGPVWTLVHVKASIAAYDAMCARAVREGLADMPLREVDLSAMADDVVDRLIAEGFLA